MKISSPQYVASIDDLLISIFLHLPLKTLIRYKLVSKHWKSLISNPGFCILRNLNPNPAIGVFVSCSNVWVNPWYLYIPFSTENSKKLMLDKQLIRFIEEPTGVRIIQSCNGLLLCYSCRPNYCNVNRYFVYNPTTNKYSILRIVDEGILGMSLAFDPSRSCYYKVVCVRGLELDFDNCQYQFEVYSSETGTWRRCGEFFAAQVNFQCSVYWNEAIHWIDSLTRDCLYFNPDDNHMQWIMLHIPDYGYRDRNYYFGESCDHLHYIDIFEPRLSVNVYEMRRDYSEWFVKYRIDLEPLVHAFPEMIRGDFDYVFSIFCLVRGEEDEDSFLVLQIPGKVLRYNIVGRNYEIICVFKGVDDVRGPWRMMSSNEFQYIESLYCV